MSKKDELMVMGQNDAEGLVSLVRSKGIDENNYKSLEALVDAYIAVETELPAYLRHPIALVEEPEDANGPFGGLINFVRRLNRIFKENQFAWEIFQSLMNRRYTTDDEARKIARQEIEAFRQEMGENLIPGLERKMTPHKEVDEDSLWQQALNWLRTGSTKPTDKKK